MTLSVKNLSIPYAGVHQISFELQPGESIAIVGESGSGKSTIAKALMNLIPRDSGEILSGGKMAMIFQDSLSTLNPTMSIGKQILESYVKHHPRESSPKEKVLELLKWVGLPESRYASYPHEFSGGMRQRILIAIALATSPKILIADEPTSALDTAIQQQIWDLLQRIKKELNMSLLFITHDLSLAARFASRILVVYQGHLVEEQETLSLFQQPQHPYTKKLLQTTSREKPAKSLTTPILEVSHLSYRTLHDLSFTLYQGETLGLVGKRGSGKTTLALLLKGLLKPTQGTITYHGSPKDIQLVFQDPYSSLNPRMRIRDSLREPLLLHGLEENIEPLLQQVGLDPSFADRYPHELSGGQRQRVVIARALAPRPKFLICDEPITALDVVTARQILDLLQHLQNTLHLTYLFISHDLHVVEQMADRILRLADPDTTI